MAFAPDYLQEIKKRKKESKVYKEFQLTGLMLAEILGDQTHKSLYIKLAKTADKGKLLALAKDIAERRGIKNKGAYFMSLWAMEKKGKKVSKKSKKRKTKKKSKSLIVKPGYFYKN